METAVWQPDGSTTLVVRRIRAEIETWDLLSVADKEAAVGRWMRSGAPLTGTAEHDEAPDSFGRPDSRLVFVSYQADITRQYLPIQRRLAEKDLLNEWTTPIGSAIFAIPPGCSEGGWIGERVLG